jgi:hypothetical protein
MAKKLLIYIFYISLILFSSFAYADFGYNNPSLPTLQPLEETSITIINKTVISSNVTEQTVLDWGFIYLTNITQSFIEGLGFSIGGGTDGVNGTYNDDWINTTIDDKIATNNNSIISWANNLFVSITDFLTIGNWSSDKSYYYNKTEIDNNNKTMAEYVLYVNSTNTGGIAEGDNLGNHNATQNISINSHWIWLSGNETIEGSTYMYSENGIIFEGVVVV